LVALSGQPLRVRVGRRLVSRCVRTYAEALAGNPVALVSSSGSVEVAVVRGNAARQLRAGVGTPVEVEVLVPRSRRASGRVAKKRS
jgi:S-adenosylmethionine hydrolase